MKLYAQHGYGSGEKILNGIEEEFIDGVIFSPRDIKRNKLRDRLEKYSDKNVDLLFDPQLYVSLFDDNPSLKKRHLSTWKYYKGYRKNFLELSENIDLILKEYYKSISSLKLTSIIAPSICISKSFNSIEAVIAKNFIRRTSNVFKNTKDKRDVYASLVIDWQAFLENEEFEAFLDDLTLIENKPKGIYLVIGSDSLNPQDEFYISEVISGWMKLNYVLNLNGYKVINGYSDLLTPLLGAVGGYAGATGWWSNLRYFKMERFIPTSSGGRMPIVRYLSKLLFNRVTFSELDAISQILPKVYNDLSTDSYYDPEPESREQEMLQSWQTIRSLNQEFKKDNVSDSLKFITNFLRNSYLSYNELKLNQIRLEKKSGEAHLINLRDAISSFATWAEIPLEN
tara:strand:- start:875 stop:2065 length:1191 start_codon:yes stop_codon:yes gene_type:complete